jgi:hypothetical protein
MAHTIDTAQDRIRRAIVALKLARDELGDIAAYEIEEDAGGEEDQAQED